MGITTSRASGTADVAIDEALCTVCGSCVRVCAGAPLELRDGRVTVDQSRVFGCIACGACVAICPTGAISVNGRDLTPEDVLPLPAVTDRAGYDALLAVMRARRSTRRFTDGVVDDETVAQILEAASTAPVGVTPSDVGVLVLQGRDKVQAFRADALAWMVKARGYLRPVLPLTRPFMSRADYEMMRDFVLPAVDIYENGGELGEGDWFFYDAPLAMCFYGCGACDPADPLIPATYAMLAAESLGLGTCMLGFPGYAVTYSKKLRAKWNLPAKTQQGIVVIFGHAELRPVRALRRRFARVDTP